MSKRNLVRAAAIGGVATLAVVTASPGYAATVVAQSTAEAFDIAIAGNSAVESGQVQAVATLEGGGETTREQPPVDVLNNQGLANVGAATQQAQARVAGTGGASAACAGIAGDGGSVAQVGEGACLTATSNFGINAANLDLTGVIVIDEESALGPIGEGVNVPLEELLSQLTGPISDGLADSPLGELDLAGTASVLEGRCTATPGAAQGDANIGNLQLTLGIPGGETFTIASFDAQVPANTPIVTDLDEVINALVDATEASLTASFAEADLGPVLTPIQDEIITRVVGQVADQLGPVEDNLLRGTLNKQAATDGGGIEVTALDLEVLPAAAESPAGSPLADIEIGRVTCDAVTARVGEPEAPEGPGDGGDGGGAGGGGALPEVPTAVDSGAEGLGSDNAALLAGGMLALAGAVAASGYRRARG